MGKEQTARVIFHVDMDAFFASVEQRDHPEYRGKPLVIGGLAGRGVVSTCSYEARRYGVHSAMPMGEAQRRCPQAIFLTGDYARYRAVSAEVFRIFAAFAPVVEPLSIDEAFLDVTGMERLIESPRAYAVQLKETIRREVGLVASVGIAPNKFLAKIASDLEKPDGLVVVPSGAAGVRAFLWPLPVRRIWGVGEKTAARLAALRVRTVGDLARMDPARLRAQFGAKTAAQLHALSLGLDDRPVAPRGEAKSIGKEETFAQDLRRQEDIDGVLLRLAEQVGWRLRRAGKKARTIQLKVRRGDFTTWTRSRTLDAPTCYDEDIYEAALSLYCALAPAGGIRLLGISAQNFGAAEELSLFDTERPQKKENLYRAIDGLKQRFGEGIIGHGHTWAPQARSGRGRRAPCTAVRGRREETGAPRLSGIPGTSYCIQKRE